LVLLVARESELRQLRKSNTDYEQQNAILQTHLENMQAAVDKLEVEVLQQRTNNAALRSHLEQLRATLTSSFTTLPLPGITYIRDGKKKIFFEEILTS
jgi:predicted RNase H-like nuclease (RuvC/YqgF family)